MLSKKDFIEWFHVIWFHVASRNSPLICCAKCSYHSRRHSCRFTPLMPIQKRVYVSVLKKESPKIVGRNSGSASGPPLQNIVRPLQGCRQMHVCTRVAVILRGVMNSVGIDWSFSGVRSFASSYEMVTFPGYAITEGMQSSLSFWGSRARAFWRRRTSHRGRRSFSSNLLEICHRKCYTYALPFWVLVFLSVSHALKLIKVVSGTSS